ncbi:glutamate 5-kinase [Candidatus Peregrinibacteria bacterium]|nr:glutamate 5-kinase [Candidatus Peregrinibacteria bacterium]
MRFVVKIGTNLLTNEDNSLNTNFIQHIVDQVASLHKKGHEAIIVTSGAVAAGRKSVDLKKESKNIPYRQALAAIGQTYLLETYQKSFEKYDIVIGQVLLTMVDLDHHQNFLSTRNTMELLLKMKTVPILNENDVTTFDEIKFGDNDNLSAHIASLLNADKLLLLTDVGGVYDSNPKENPNAKCLRVIEKVDESILSLADGGSDKGIGGMESKLKSAQFATEAGVDVWIADGNEENVIIDLVEEKKHHGTHFQKQFGSKETRRKWLQTKQVKGASITLDEGAVKALLERGKSLLSSGITAVEGEFERGNVVVILGPNKEKVGFGQVNYNAEELVKIKGAQSEEIEKILGYALEKEAIHRDNMVV